MLSGIFPRIANPHLAKALAIFISSFFLSSLAWSSENTPLYDGRLVWAKRNADKLYILSSKKSTPDVLLDIPKAFGISKKIPTTISLAAIGESIFWLDYDYAYSKKKDLPMGTSKNMLLQRINGHEKAALWRHCNRTAHDVYSNTSLGSWFNAWCFHDATAT
jgi:hypothetical protein